MLDDSPHAQQDEKWMRHAIRLAQHAEEKGEVPVGAVLVCDGEILAEGWNQPITLHDPTAHAEIIALRQAAQKISNYRLPLNSTLYVTLEPCAMCAGAMIHARVSRLVIGANEPKAGAAGSVFDIAGGNRFNHTISVCKGVLEPECSQQLKAFFKKRR